MFGQHTAAAGGAEMGPPFARDGAMPVAALCDESGQRDSSGTQQRRGPALGDPAELIAKES